MIGFLDLSPDVQPEFLYHFLSSITDNIREKAKQGSGQPNLNTDIVKELRFALPPLLEQQQVMKEVRTLVERFDGLSCETQAAIDLLVERRAALITMAVTGQIDVRNIDTERAA